MGMMGNERGRRGRQTERHSQGESRSTRAGGWGGQPGRGREKKKWKNRKGGLIERGRHKVELELFFPPPPSSSSFFPNVENQERGPRELQEG